MAKKSGGRGVRSSKGGGVLAILKKVLIALVAVIVLFVALSLLASYLGLIRIRL
jgi:hypothetical protein